MSTATLEEFNLSLLNNSEYSDLTIECGRSKFKVHKIFVCQVEFFKNALKPGFAEHATNLIRLDDKDENAVNAMLQWLYSGTYEVEYTAEAEPEVITEETTNDTLEQMQAIMSMDFQAKIYVLGEKYCIDNLKWHALHKIQQLLDSKVLDLVKNANHQMILIMAAVEIFEGTPESAREVRKVVFDPILENLSAMFVGEKESVLLNKALLAGSAMLSQALLLEELEHPLNRHKRARECATCHHDPGCSGATHDFTLSAEIVCPECGVWCSEHSQLATTPSKGTPRKAAKRRR